MSSSVLGKYVDGCILYAFVNNVLDTDGVLYIDGNLRASLRPIYIHPFALSTRSVDVSVW